MIRTEKINKIFPIAGGESFRALKDININIPGGCLSILKGRSGSGKTTLMNIIGALDRPTDGNVFFDDKNITEMTDADRDLLRRREIGFVFQSVALIPMMTAYENVEFGLRLAGYSGDRKARAEEALRLVGLSGRANHLPQEMSGGEQQRVAIARAIAHKPSVLFADEPTAELDTNTGLQVVKIFKDLVATEGITVIMTTHDTGLMEIGDAVFELEDGEIING